MSWRDGASMLKILLVEDDEMNRELTCRAGNQGANDIDDRAGGRHGGRRIRRWGRQGGARLPTGAAHPSGGERLPAQSLRGQEGLQPMCRQESLQSLCHQENM